MSAAVFATLLRDALPGAAVLDLGLPSARVYPWWPGARCGVVDAATLDPAEAALLRRFRQGARGVTVWGLGAAGDARLLTSEDGPALLVLDGSPPPSVAARVDARTFVLQRGGTEAQAPLPGPDRGRIMLLGGGGGGIERWDLLLPPESLASVFDRLHAAAHRLAAALGGTERWQVGGRVAMPRLASLGMMATGPERLPPVEMPAEALMHDLPDLATGNALPFGAAVRARILLGALPARPVRLRLRLRGADPAQAPTLFVNGVAVTSRCGAADGAVILEATVRFREQEANILGLALPPGHPAGLAILGLGIAA